MTVVTIGGDSLAWRPRSPFAKPWVMEELRYAFARDQPLLAWRLFRVRRVGEAYALCSPMIHSPAPPPWKPGLARAVCLEHRHSAPAPGCRCGIYGAVEGTLDSLPGYLVDTRYDRDPWAYAEIACSGRVFVDARGVRCEEALLVKIALTEDSFPAEDAWRRASERLAAHYGVPVELGDSAPAWLTSNARGHGPPQDFETVNLAILESRLRRGAQGR